MKQLERLEFFLWLKKPDAVNHVYAGIKRSAAPTIGAAIRELSENYKARGDSTLVIQCNRPRTAVPAMPVVNSKKRKEFEKREEIPFQEVESLYHVKFQWFDSLSIKISEALSEKRTNVQIQEKKILAEVHPQFLEEMAKVVEQADFPGRHGRAWIWNDTESKMTKRGAQQSQVLGSEIWIAADWLGVE